MTFDPVTPVNFMSTVGVVAFGTAALIAFDNYQLTRGISRFWLWSTTVLAVGFGWTALVTSGIGPRGVLFSSLPGVISASVIGFAVIQASKEEKNAISYIV